MKGGREDSGGSVGAHTKAGRHERGRNVLEPQVMVCDEGSGQDRDLSEV